MLHNTAQKLLRTLRMPAVREVLLKTAGFLALFCMARAELSQGFSPFCAAVSAGAWMAGAPPILLFGALCGAAGQAAWPSFCAASLTLFFALIAKQIAGKVVKRQAALCTALGCAAGVLAFCLSTPYDFLMGVLSATAAVLLSRIYAMAFSLLRLLKVRKQLTDEEVISLAIAGGTLLLGLKDAAVWGLSLPVAAGSAATLVAAYTGGVGAGASTGVALGVLLAMGGESSALALFGLCGVTAGCMRRLGRWGAASGGLLACAATAFATRADLLAVGNGLLAGALFLALPAGAFKQVGKFVNASSLRDQNRRDYLLRLRSAARERLYDYSAALDEMGRILESPLPDPPRADWDLSALRPLCERCAAKNRCWSDEKRLKAELEQVLKGWETPWRLDRCPQLDALAATAKALFASLGRERAARRQANEYLAISGRQLGGLSGVVKSLADSLYDDVSYDDRLEARILAGLQQAGIEAADAVAELSSGRLYVTVCCERCTNACDSAMRQAVSAACGRPMRLASRQCKKGCRTVYEQQSVLSVKAGIAQHAKEKVCGDTALTEDLPDGRFLIALADGMGSGKAAHRESADALNLLVRLYRAGIDTQTSLLAVNRLLALRSKEDMYTTLDCCVIDLSTGRAEFAKHSAAPTVWLRPDGAELLTGDSLPAGILENAPPATTVLTLSAGDWLVFLSDGATDALKGELASLCATAACGDPQGAAICIAQAALSRGSDDDVTVVAVRIS